MDGPATARRMWRLFEPLHAVTYFASESRDAYGDAGLKGFWMGYFAGRSAPMGEVGPAVVEATFFNFAPVLVRRAIPDAWAFSTPSAVLEARLTGADRALRRVLGPLAVSADVEEAADLLSRAAECAGFSGRPLAASNAELAWLDDSLLVLWQAATILREHRGDGHVAALVVAGLDGCQAHVSFTATGAIGREALQPNRGWTDQEWAAAEAELLGRGWIDKDGRATGTGRAARREIEDTTDRLAAQPWERLGEGTCTRLAELLRPLADSVTASGVIPVMNPIGLPPK
jgi:hypothetical protein